MMKKYIIIPCILSILGHSVFFGVFKADIKHKLPFQNPQLYFITKEQYDYIASVPKKVGDILLSPLPKSFSFRNVIWGDTLEIIKDTDIAKICTETREDIEFLSDSKGYNFQEIQIPLGYLPELNLDFLPIYSDIFFTGLLPEREPKDGEYTVKLNNDIKMSCYVQGPISSRGLILDNIPSVRFNIDKDDVKVKLRFWVTKDGRINQVIVEESSSFPLIDSEIINLFKTWLFRPVYDSSTPNYEWGIVNIRMRR